MGITLKQKNCISYKKGTSPLSDSLENDLLTQVTSWSVERNGLHRLKKQFSFNSFVEEMGFIKAISIVADEERHYPSISSDYNKVSIELSTQAINGLSENDFILAARIDEIYSLITQPAKGVLESAIA